MNKAKKRKVEAAGDAAGDAGSAASDTSASRSLHHLNNYSKNTIIAAFALMDELVIRMNFTDISSKLLQKLPLESADVTQDKAAINMLTEGLWGCRIARNQHKSGKLAINTVIAALKIAVAIAHHIVNHVGKSPEVSPLIEYVAAVITALVKELKATYSSGSSDDADGGDSVSLTGPTSHRFVFDSFMELLHVITESTVLTALIQDATYGYLRPHVNAIAGALYQGLVLVSIDIPVKKRFELFTTSLLSATLQYYECIHTKSLQPVPSDLAGVMHSCFTTLLFSIDDENLFDELMSIPVALSASGGRGHKKSYYHGIFDGVTHCVLALRQLAATHDYGGIYLLYQVFGKASLAYSQVQQNTPASMHQDAVLLLAHRKHCQRLLHVCFLFMNAIQLDEHLLDVAVIHYQLLQSLAESLKLAGSSVIPNHESLLPYIAYLKEYTHTIVKHIQSRSAPVPAMGVITVLLDVLRQVISIDHHVLTDNAVADSSVSPLASITTLFESLQTSEAPLLRSSHQLLNVIIELYSNLRKTDELILLLISHAGGAASTPNSLLCVLLDDLQIRQQLLGMFQRLPIGQINHIWLTLSQGTHQFTHIQCILVCCYCVATREFASNQFNNVPVTSLLDLINQLIAIVNHEVVGVQAEQLTGYYYRVSESICALLDLLSGIIPYRSSSGEDLAVLVKLHGVITTFITAVATQAHTCSNRVLLTLFPVVLNGCRVINTIDAYVNDEQMTLTIVSTPIWTVLDSVLARHEALDATSMELVMDYILRLDRIVPIGDVSPARVTQLAKVIRAYVTQVKEVAVHIKSQRSLSLLDSPLLSQVVPRLITQQLREVTEALKGSSATKKRKNTNAVVLQQVQATTAVITVFEPLALLVCVEDTAVLKDLIILITSLTPTAASDEVYALLGAVCRCVSKARQAMYDAHPIAAWNETFRPFLLASFPQLLQAIQHLVVQANGKATALVSLVCLCIDSLLTHLLKHQSAESSNEDSKLCGVVCDGIRSLVSEGGSVAVVGVELLRTLSTAICSLDYNYFYQENLLTTTARSVLHEYEAMIASIQAKDASVLLSGDLLVLVDSCRVVSKLSAHDSDYIRTYKASLETIIVTKFRDINTCDAANIRALLLLVGCICSLSPRSVLSAQGLESQLHRMFLITQHVACQGSTDVDFVTPFELCLRNILQCSQLATHTHFYVKFMEKLSAIQDCRSALVVCRLLLEYAAASASTANTVINIVIQIMESTAANPSFMKDEKNILFYCETIKAMVEHVKSKGSSAHDTGAVHHPLLGTCLLNSCCSMTTYVRHNRRSDSVRGALGVMSVILKCMETLLTIPSCSILFTTNVTSLLTIIQHTIQLVISSQGYAQDDVFVSCTRSMSKVLKTVATSNELMKHAYIFVTAIITVMSESTSFTNNVRDVLYNGIFCLLEKCKSKEKALIVSQLTATAKVLYSTIHLVFQEEWKFIGKA